MKIAKVKRGKVNILHLSGKMTIGEGDVMLREEVRKLLDEGETHFILDMLGVPFMDSASIGEVVACSKRAGEKKGLIKLVMKDRVHNLFTMTRLDRVFDIYDGVEDALAGFVT
ncbi:MAG: STAS domain-containing protein [Acidobacteria bacterium]|nr:STAS domain-containing protein [Acidobacteriota bacterium]